MKTRHYLDKLVCGFADCFDPHPRRHWEFGKRSSWRKAAKWQVRNICVMPRSYRDIAVSLCQRARLREAIALFAIGQENKTESRAHTSREETIEISAYKYPIY